MTRNYAIGPVFVDCTITDERYRELLVDRFFPMLQEAGYDLNTLWFQQDFVPAHTANGSFTFTVYKCFHRRNRMRYISSRDSGKGADVKRARADLPDCAPTLASTPLSPGDKHHSTNATNDITKDKHLLKVHSSLKLYENRTVCRAVFPA
jgi:hypothetical protein